VADVHKEHRYASHHAELEMSQGKWLAWIRGHVSGDCKTMGELEVGKAGYDEHVRTKVDSWFE
jgi:hypothetical protein